MKRTSEGTRHILRLYGLFCCALLLIALFTPQAAHARQRQLHIVMTEWVPYTSSNMVGKGALAEMAEIAFKLQGLAVQFSIVPWQRAVDMMDRHEADALLPVYTSPRNKGRYYLSDSMLSVDSVFVRLKDMQIPYKQLDDLIAWRIGVVKDTSYAATLGKQGPFIVEEAPHELMNYRKLVTGRIELMLDTRETIERMMDSLPASERKPLEYMEPPYQTSTLHLAFHPTDTGKKLRDMFNDGLAMLHDKGIYAAILEKHSIARSTGHPVRHIE
ncbi:transporter substrate-binding domain-containing protein [Desulfovibrio subterraneus]|jgi:polar amino acid transport system substrate-binding protein|uniref:substrate-binding periplasmic protein n=1 Tax=Desulfovibrio subterraneus TaxID=2718620 RepID=UPI0022B8BAAB|nr:transporter substrate-binding domain-containing protein [Desulfovibrio subterraneus]WBF66846.1 transporter substrate-binding domain-containing protein [Desulfovibrio subterraneus]